MFMSARILVAAGLDAVTRSLAARLAADYFEVLTARSGEEALRACLHEPIDVALLDLPLPGLSGVEVCRALKSEPATAGMAVALVTGQDRPEDRAAGFSVGADDFLSKPVDPLALITRVRNLARMRVLNEELAQRTRAFQRMGLPTPAAAPAASRPARILLIEDDRASLERASELLGPSHFLRHAPDTASALDLARNRAVDLVLVSLGLAHADPLRLCSRIRSCGETRDLPIIALSDPGNPLRLLRALDMGVNDYILRPMEKYEALARVRTQLARWRHSELLRSRLTESLELAMRDELTGLHNSRYMKSRLRELAEVACRTRRPLALLIADIDQFKDINDAHGHAAGDAVLREVGTRLRRAARPSDAVCRLGGEEFALLLPGTDLRGAIHIGEQLRASICGDSFQIETGVRLWVTASIGVAAWAGEADSASALVRRADQALYAAKRAGRNRVAAAPFGLPTPQRPQTSRSSA
jgi:two-component system cell cycle response regulator